jgi:hypothetical protein
VGSVLSAVYRSNVDVTGLSPEASGQVRGSFALASHLGGPVSQHAQTAFTGGMQAGLLVAAGAALSAALGVVLLLGTRSSSTAPERERRLELGGSTR